MAKKKDLSIHELAELKNDAFKLGMIVAFLGEETLEVEMTEADDKDKIDFRLNGFPIQQKFDWKNREEVCELQEHLWAKGTSSWSTSSITITLQRTVLLSR